MISDEAVQAAMEAFLLESSKRKGELGGSSLALLSALEAAAPHIAAEAWDEGRESVDFDSCGLNPYRSQARTRT